MSKFKILFALTGSISCYKACYLISSLKKEGCEVQCITTDSSEKFIGRATLEGLSHKKVLSSMFEDGQHLDHINLARWADLIIIYPASANTINKLAGGIADNLIGALFLANNFKKPFWIAPSMNSNMLAHPATVQSIVTLQKWGSVILPTEEGVLACGEEGLGRLVEPDYVFAKIKNEVFR
ncbi:MAG: flavoprotein [Bacteriovoracaceae bacterium]|nr:flavoprotein [Bacteriovoracaceae bacterium]